MNDLVLGKFLVDEPPLLVFRSLVIALGLHEAVFLQQLHYWLHQKSRSPDRYSDHFIHGRFWVHWTYEEMAREIPLGGSTLDIHKRVVRQLKARGILLVEHHGPAWDRTNWYSINHEALARFLGKRLPPPPSSVGDASDALVTAPPMHTKPIPPSIGGHAFDGDEELPDLPSPRRIGGNFANHKTKTETTSKTTTKRQVVVADAESEGQVVGPATLILDSIPEELRAGVLQELKGVVQPQLFADLLAARIERNANLPPTRGLGSPILWLRQMIRISDRVDYAPAVAFAARRNAAESERRLAEERLERESAKERDRIAAQTQAISAANARVEAMSEAERQALVFQANRGHQVPRVADDIAKSVRGGTLPEHPLARAMVLNALRSPPFSPPVGGPSA